MKSVSTALIAVLLWSFCQLPFAWAVGEDSARPANGYFKCKYGTLEIVDADAVFSVVGENTKTYRLSIEFRHKPMTAADISSMKEGFHLSEKQGESMKEDEYPNLCFILLNEWPIGKMPPITGTNIYDLRFKVAANTVQLSPKKAWLKEAFKSQLVQYSIVPDGNEFWVAGKLVGKAPLRIEGNNNVDFEWNINFATRSYTWVNGKNGLGLEQPKPEPAFQTWRIVDMSDALREFTNKLSAALNHTSMNEFLNLTHPAYRVSAAKEPIKEPLEIADIQFYKPPPDFTTQIQTASRGQDLHLLGTNIIACQILLDRHTSELNIIPTGFYVICQTNNIEIIAPWIHSLFRTNDITKLLDTKRDGTNMFQWWIPKN